MKVTINHMVYDTIKATLVADNDNGLSGNDFRAWMENLYLSKNGNWFRYGWGGPMIAITL